MKLCEIKYRFVLGALLCTWLMGTFVLMAPAAIADELPSITYYEKMLTSQLVSMSKQESDQERLGRIYAVLGSRSNYHSEEDRLQFLARANSLLAADDWAGRSLVSASQCWAHTMVNGIDKAPVYCDKGIEMAELSEDDVALSKAYGVAAAMYYQMGFIEKAFSASHIAVDSAERTNIRQLIGIQNNSMGLILRAQGLYQKGLERFGRGLEGLDPLSPEHVDIHKVLSFNVGLSYADLGEHELAKEYYEKTLRWAQEGDRYNKELTSLIYLAISDIALGQADVAIASLMRALTRIEFKDNYGYLGFAYAVMGEAYLALNELEPALKAYAQGIKHAEVDPNTFEHRRLKVGYARALYLNGQVDKAKLLLNATVQQLEQEQSNEMLAVSYKLLSEIEEANGDYASSLAAYKKSDSVIRISQNQVLEHELALLRSDYQLFESERELSTARQQSIVRNGLVIFALTLAFIAYLFYSRRIAKQRADERARQAHELESVVEQRTGELRQRVVQANDAENARVALERQLAEAEKLRVLGQLTGGVAHDFNNLLTVIIGAADVLSENLKDNEDYVGLLRHIITAAASGADITRALMAYARKQPLQLETVNINALLEDRIPLIGRTLGGMVDVQLHFETDAQLDVVLDSSQLTTALLNLALNARDAQNNQGELIVEVSVREGKWAVIAVQDQGVGMSNEQLERAVEPFFTTKPEQGNGLGLSMVYGFSKQLGGDLEIESSRGVGTQVRIVLPLADAALMHDVGSAGQYSEGDDLDNAKSIPLELRMLIPPHQTFGMQ